MAILTLPGSGARTAAKAKALVFEDPGSRELLLRIEQVAPSEATVLVTGETGTGKEIVARHVHALSRRADRPFVAVNCGALAETLVDSELFGHDRGAFTGAVTAKDGWFAAANGGTLFLDEIGDLPLAIQVKLLRVLQEREVVRIGSRRPEPIDVRLVAATHVDLREAVAAGRFREDLFYRVSVATLRVPPLRERPGDLLALARHFLAQYGGRLALGEVELTADAVEALLAHPWPGNVRELENVMHHALLVSQRGRIDTCDLGLVALHPGTPSPAAQRRETAALEAAFVALFERNLPDLHSRVEETLVRSAYRFCHRNQLQTARLLGVSRNVVRARLIDYGDLTARRPAGTPSRAEQPPDDDTIA